MWSISRDMALRPFGANPVAKLPASAASVAEGEAAHTKHTSFRDAGGGPNNSHESSYLLWAS